MKVSSCGVEGEVENFNTASHCWLGEGVISQLQQRM